MSRQPTSKSPQWLRRKEARPGEITEAALACFAERGFAATRLEDVAKRAGVTKGTLYLYFPNKAELFKAVVRQSVVVNLARTEAAVQNATGPAPEILARILFDWASRINTPAGAIPKIVLAEVGNFPEIAKFYLDEVVARGRRQIVRILQLGIKRGEFRALDIERTVDCIVGPMLLGMLWQHSFYPRGGQPLDPEALCRTLLDILARGLETNSTPDRDPAKGGAAT